MIQRMLASRPTTTPRLRELLQGRTLVRERIATDPGERTWIEIRLTRGARPAYPLRTPPHAMLGNSKFQPACPPEQASFELRYATFSRADIEQAFDPNYDQVGEYIHIPSVTALKDFLAREQLDIEDFIDAGATDYPA